METMKQQWEETEEEGGVLRGRLPPQHSSTNTSCTTTCDFTLSSESCSEEDGYPKLETEEKGSWGRNGSLDSDKNGGTESDSYELSRFNGGHVDNPDSKRNPGDEISGLDVKVVDVSFQESDVTNHQDEGDIRKGEEELPVFGSSPSKQSIEQNGHYDSLSNGGTNHGNGIAKTREIEEQEASELYLERVYQKPAAHDFYCPHCNTCITKVIIRGSESEVTPRIVQSVPSEPVDPIRCMSCFSFLIPAGNWFFIPRLIPKDEESNTEQGTNIKIVEVGEPVPAHDSNGRLQDQNSQTVSVSKDYVPSESAGASVGAIGKPTMPGQSVRVEFEAPLSGQKPTSLGQSVGVTFEVPSRNFNEAFYGQKSTMLGQSVGVEFAAPSNGLNETSTKSAQSVGVEFAAPSNGLIGTSYGQKPTTSAQSVGVEFSVPSQDLNVTWYGPKPTLSAQSVEGSTADSIHKAPMPGELVETGVGIIAAKAKPSGNTESSVGVQVLASSNDSNGTLQNQNPPAVGHSVEVSVHVTNKPASSEINVVAISPDVPQSNGAVASEGNILDCALGETYAGKTEPRESTTVIITQSEAATIPEQGDTKSLEILKSIVYGGLTEAITSLGIVTSAASADTATLNILALALANMFGGLFVIGHHLWELKSDQSRVPSSETGEQVDRYQKVLGKKENFFLHASVAILSFLVFGLVPPLVYGFSFRQSNNRDLKMAAVAAASLLCIIVLAIGKAHIHKPPKYIKTLLYYIAIGIGVGGLTYLAGDLIDKLIEKLGWFASNVSGNLLLPQMGVVRPALESY